MFCKKCGKEIKEGVRFCPYCGAESGVSNEMKATESRGSKKEKTHKKSIRKKIWAVAVSTGILLLCGGGAFAMYKAGVASEKKERQAQEAEEKKVHIAIFSISKIVYLVIHNTTNEITFDIRKIYEEGYSTKGENRGLGLNNVRKILANYGTMFLETELQGNRFLQVLKIGGYEQE